MILLPIAMFILIILADYETMQDIKTLYSTKFSDERVEKILVRNRNTNNEHIIFKTESSSEYFPVYLQSNQKLDSLFNEDAKISKAQYSYGFSLFSNNRIYNLRFLSISELIRNWTLISLFFEPIIIALLIVQLFRTDSILRK